MNHTELYIYACTQAIYQLCFTFMSSAKHNILEIIIPTSPHAMQSLYLQC